MWYTPKDDKVSQPVNFYAQLEEDNNNEIECICN